MENAIEINSLTKKYKGFLLDNISLCILRDNARGIDSQNGRLRLAFRLYEFRQYRTAGSDSDIPSLC